MSNVVDMESRVDAITRRLKEIDDRMQTLRAESDANTKENNKLFKERQELEAARHTLNKYLP